MPGFLTRPKRRKDERGVEEKTQRGSKKGLERNGTGLRNAPQRGVGKEESRVI